MADTLLFRSQLMHDLFWESFPDHPVLLDFLKNNNPNLKVCLCVCVCVCVCVCISILKFNIVRYMAV